MKVSKEGKITLTKLDYRVGNFVFTNFADSVGFSDISQTVQTKVSKRTFVGQMLADAISQKMDRFLHNYGGVLFYLVGLAPDKEFIEESFAAARRCVERNASLYGCTGDEKKDAAALEEVKALSGLEKAVKEDKGQ